MQYYLRKTILIKTPQAQIKMIHKSKPAPNLSDYENLFLLAGRGLGDTLVAYGILNQVKQLSAQIKTTLLCNPAYFPVLDPRGIDTFMPVSCPLGSTQPSYDYETHCVRQLLNLQTIHHSKNIFLWGQLNPENQIQELTQLRGYHIMTDISFSKNTQLADRKIRVKALSSSEKMPLVGYRLGWGALADYFESDSKLKLDPEIHLNHEMFKNDFKKPSNWIYFNPIASIAERTINFSNSLQILKKLAKAHPYLIFVLDSGMNSHQKTYNLGLVEELSKLGIKNLKLLPENNLVTLVTYLKQCQCVITVDSGVSHLCNTRQLRDIPSVVIYNSDQSLQEWGVEYSKRKNILSNLGNFEKISQGINAFLRTIIAIN